MDKKPFILRFVSATNGHRLSLPEIRDEIEILEAQDRLRRLRAHEARAQRLDQVREMYYGYTSNQWGGLVDPMDAFRDSDLRVTPFGTAGRADRRDGYNRPFVWAEIDLDFQRAQARWLATRNMLGVGLVGTLTTYTVRTGYRYEVRPRAKFRCDAVMRKLASIGQDVLDEFTSFNALECGNEQLTWAMREAQSVEKGLPDGEVLHRVFDQGDGTCLVRFIEPEQIRQPSGTGPECTFGVENVPGDVERIVAYHVDYDGDGQFERVDAADVSHLKFNVPSCVKRGLSDFYSTAEALDLTQKMLRNMITAGGIQAALPWIEQYDGATFSALQAHIDRVKDSNHPNFVRPFVGRDINYRKYEPGEIPVIGAGRTYIPQPTAVNSGSHAQTVQACMRAVGVRWGMPEYMVSGDASNAAYASTLVAGSPFVVRTEYRQGLSCFGGLFVRTLWRGPIRSAARVNRFTVRGRAYSYEELSRILDIVPTPPQVAIVDPNREAEVDHKDLAAGVISIQTRRARRGLDGETETTNLQQMPLPRVAGKVTDLDQAGETEQPEEDDSNG